MKRLLFVLLLVACLPLMAQQQSTVIPIGNSWVFGAGTRVVDVLPDGSDVIIAGYGGTFSQDTGVKASALQESNNGLYVLQFSAKNYYFSYPGYYEAKVFLGTQELCSTDGRAIGPWVKGTLVCPVSNYFILYGWPGTPHVAADHTATIRISFSGEGYPVLFDNVSLTFTPQ